MSKKKIKSPTRMSPGMKIINPESSRVPTTTITPFADVAPMEAVRPVQISKSRQITQGPSVKIIGRKAI
jgi:hypothetical protein